MEIEQHNGAIVYARSSRGRKMFSKTLCFFCNDNLFTLKTRLCSDLHGQALCFLKVNFKVLDLLNAMIASTIKS